MKKTNTIVRTEKELQIFLLSALQIYDSALAVHKNKAKAKQSVIESYDDLHDWLYTTQRGNK